MDPIINISLAETIKEARLFADWLLAIPRNAARMINETGESILDRKTRLRRQAELLELRELQKALSNLYLTKGSAAGWVRSLQARPSSESAKQVRFLFEEIATGLSSLKQAARDLTALGPLLGAEATYKLGHGEAVYAHLAKLSDEDLLTSTTLGDIQDTLETLRVEAEELIQKIDAERRRHDYTY